MPTTGELLAVTWVFGSYRDYIAPYLAALLLAYPAATARVYCREPLSRAQRAAVTLVSSEISERFEVVEGEPFPLLPEYEDRSTTRFLLGREHFTGFTYGLIHDVDLLVIPESPTLVEQELERCRLINQPYANVVRTAPGMRDMMAGWHFFIVAPYFEAMQPVIARCRAVRPPLASDHNIASDNERLLYATVKEGLGVLEHDELRPYAWVLEHGFHLGMQRGVTDRIAYPAWWRDNPAWRAAGLALLTDPRFVRLGGFLPERVAYEIAMLETHLRSVSAH
jgi:hypothetical protein